MSDRLSLGHRWAKAVQEAEEHASAVMAAADDPHCPVFDDEGAYRWYVATFGASRAEFEDMRDALARRYRQVSFWRRGLRRQIIADYIRVEGLLTAASGLETMWR